MTNPNPENIDVGFEVERFHLTNDRDQLDLAFMARFPIFCPHNLLWHGGFKEDLEALCATVGGMNDVHQPTPEGEKRCGVT